MTEALGDQVTEAHQTVAAYGGVGGDSMAMHHGHGGRKDQLDIDVDRFFRVIDRAILDHHSKPSELPLILAALPEHHGRFREISRNPFLLAEGVKIYPDATSINELRNRAWEALEPQYEQRIATLIEEFSLARSKRRGFEELEKGAELAAHGRVGTLLIDGSRHIPGRIDAETGQVQFGESGDFGFDDLLDDLGDLVLRKGGQTIVLPPDRMPTQTGAAIICRF